MKPFDTELLDEVGRTFRRVITVEDGCLRGGVGEAVAAYFIRKQILDSLIQELLHLLRCRKIEISEESLSGFEHQNPGAILIIIIRVVLWSKRWIRTWKWQRNRCISLSGIS